MRIDQAARLREICYSSFGIGLKIKNWRLNECTLYMLKSEANFAHLEILRRLASKLDLQVKEDMIDYRIIDYPVNLYRFVGIKKRPFKERLNNFTP